MQYCLSNWRSFNTGRQYYFFSCSVHMSWQFFIYYFVLLAWLLCLLAATNEKSRIMGMPLNFVSDQWHPSMKIFITKVIHHTKTHSIMNKKWYYDPIYLYFSANEIRKIRQTQHIYILTHKPGIFSHLIFIIFIFIFYFTRHFFYSPLAKPNYIFWS